MTLFQACITAGFSILALFSLLWLISLKTRDASIVDNFWGAGFVISALIYFLNSGAGYLPRKLLLLVLVTVWGVRLSVYITVRNRGKGEDFRYQKFRADGGEGWWWKSYFKVFLLQAGLMWIISIPLLAAQWSATPALLTWIDYFGLAVWAFGFYFEAVGDWQLARFKADPANKGRLFTGGVWRYTRHPNYFGDAAQWWGFYLIALAAGGYWTIFSPLIMTFLLLRVSGVALLETSLKNEKPGYAAYQDRTNAFFPWFPDGESP